MKTQFKLKAFKEKASRLQQIRDSYSWMEFQKEYTYMQLIERMAPLIVVKLKHCGILVEQNGKYLCNFQLHG